MASEHEFLTGYLCKNRVSHTCYFWFWWHTMVAGPDNIHMVKHIYLHYPYTARGKRIPNLLTLSGLQGYTLKSCTKKELNGHKWSKWRKFCTGCYHFLSFWHLFQYFRYFQKSFCRTAISNLTIKKLWISHWTTIIF